MGLTEATSTQRSPGRAARTASVAISADALAAPRAERRRALAFELLAACRPRQWSKNLLVLAAPCAAGVLFHPEVPGQVSVAFVSFCLLSSSTYLLNDVHDRHEDASNPRKRTRAIASGEVSVPLAVGVALVLALAGLGLAASLRPALAAVGAGYLALTASYTLWWRGMAVADMAAVSACFVIRALAGGVATAVPLSRWFVIVTSFGALFLVAGKRHAELQARTAQRTSEHAALRSRASLSAYSAAYLRSVMTLAAAVAIGAYCLWAFQHRRSGAAAWYDLTILPLVMWFLRYALLADQGCGQAPEELALSDRFLLTMSVAWTAIFAGAVYAAG